MNTPAASPIDLDQRPKRADARRNYEKLLAAAREAFTEADTETSLEDIARRAGVGIGTLYRHFPTRRHLIEAVYVDEVRAISESATEVAGLPAWDALVAWLHRYVDYVATKQALAAELLAEDASADVFANCREALFAAAGPLLERAQREGGVREDVDFVDVLHLVSGISRMNTTDEAQLRRILDVALDGLRARP